MICTMSNEPGKLFDFLKAMTLGYNRDSKGGEPETAPSEINDAAWDGVRRDTSGLETILSQSGEGPSYLEWRYLPELWRISTCENFISEFITQTHKDLVISLFAFYDRQKHTNEYYARMMGGNGTLFGFIDGMQASDRVKWELMKLINEPEPVMKGLKNFMCAVLRRLDKIYEANGALIEKFRAYANEKIQSRPGGIFLIDDKSGLEDMIDTHKFDSFEITGVLQNSMLFWTRPDGRRLEIYVSVNYEEMLDSRSSWNNWFNLRQALRALSDDTRHQIFRLLCEKEMYLTEIAEKLDQSISSTVHHLEILNRARVITTFGKGKKRYYTIAKKQMNNYVKRFAEYYKMQ